MIFFKVEINSPNDLARGIEFDERELMVTEYLPADLKQSYRVITGSLSDEERKDALQQIAHSGNTDGARVLCEMIKLTSWAPLRCEIISYLSVFEDLRTIEFLFRLVRFEEDLSVAREALCALARMGHPFAVEMVTSIALQSTEKLRMEALNALAGVPFLFSDDELVSILSSAHRRGEDPRFLEILLVVLAKHGDPRVENELSRLLKESSSGDLEEGRLIPILLAAGSVLSEAILRQVESLELSDSATLLELRNLVAAQMRERLSISIQELARRMRDPRMQSQTSGFFPQLRNRAGDIAFKIELLAALDDDPVARLWAEIELADFSSIAAIEPLLVGVLRDGNDSQIAVFFQRLSRGLKQEAWQVVLSQLQNHELARTGLLIAHADLHGEILGRLAAISAEEKVEQGVSLCNALVMQCYVSRDKKRLNATFKQLVKMSTDVQFSAALRGRVLRAMGQIANTANHAEKIVAHLVKLHDRDREQRPSIYHALGHTAHHESMYSLIEILSQEEKLMTLEKKESRAMMQNSLDLAYNALCAYPESLLRTVSIHLHPNHAENSSLHRHYLRLISAGAELVGLDRSIIQSALCSIDYSDNLLGLHACRALEDAHDWGLVLDLCEHENESIAAVAVKTIFACKRGKIQNQLVRILKDENTYSTDLLLHCLNLTEIDKDDPPIELGIYLREAAHADPSEHRWAFVDPRLREEAYEVADMILSLQDDVGAADEHSSGRRQDAENTLVDRSLTSHLPSYPHYSEALKSVLRNSELVFCYPEIFNDAVDKSTVTLELVKAIDLLLQERIGEALFLGQRSAVLQRLRTRVAEMGLATGSLNNRQMLQVLKIDNVFTPELFPSIKLSKLIQSVQSGKFVTEQVKILDGLKGWSVFLLLFARRYRGAGIPLAEAIDVADQSQGGDRITTLAWELIMLQEKRNVSAHRGTVLDVAELNEAREKALSVLNMIDDCFPVRQRGHRLTAKRVSKSA